MAMEFGVHGRGYNTGRFSGGDQHAQGAQGCSLDCFSDLVKDIQQLQPRFHSISLSLILLGELATLQLV